jgi:hypothetical protein
VKFRSKASIFNVWGKLFNGLLTANLYIQIVFTCVPSRALLGRGKISTSDPGISEVSQGGQRHQQAGKNSHAFLLRCWQEPEVGGALRWRFSLTHIGVKRNKKGFTNLEALMAHVQKILIGKISSTSEGEQP